MTVTRIRVALLLLSGGCAGCYHTSTPGEDGAIWFDASPPTDAEPADSSAMPLDPESLQSCGDGDRWPIDPIPAGCERYRGPLDFAYAPITDLSGLASLRWIDGTLNIFSPEGLTSVTGLERLEHVGGDLNIRLTNDLESIAPLHRLRRVEGDLFIDGNRGLGSFRGLERLEEVGGLLLDVYPYFREEVNLDVLERMRRIRGDAEFRNIRREEVDAFLARVEVGGSVTFDGEVIPGAGGEAGP